MFERMEQVIEPSSAVTIAAGMTGKLGVTGKKIVHLISGGNVDIRALPDLLESTM